MCKIAAMGRARRDRPGAGDTKYVLPDPQLRAYDQGVGTLKVGGVLKGHLASVVGQITFPTPSPWPWFVIVWTDGTKEPPFEDYGPGWYTVRELEAGVLDHFGPSIRLERRGLFGRRVNATRTGPRCVFEFAWLPRDEAAAMWRELSLADSDF
jgi:hypothetical protein